jgi:ribosomal protein S30
MSVAKSAPPRKRNVRKHYVRVVIVWIVTLAALYALQQSFS